MTEATVEEVMTTPVLTVDPEDRPADVARAMLDSGVNSVVVVDDDCRPVGILTSTDYVAMTAEGTDPHATTVEELATTGVVTAEVGDPVRAAAESMGSHDVSHLPVVDDGTVVGILTTTDTTAYLAGTGG